MLPIHFLLIALLAGAQDPPPQAVYSQSYVVFMKGVPSGTETVTESLDREGNTLSRSEHELFLSDGLETKRMAFTTTMLLAKGTLSPLKYVFQYTSGDKKDSYVVTVKDGRITRVLTRAGHSVESTAAAKPGTVILDFSVYHQYDWIVRRYDLKRGGVQSFPNFIPVIGAEMPLKVTLLPDSNFGQGKGDLPLRNFKVEYVGVWSGLLSTDRNNRLVRLTVASQDLDVIRKDLIPDQK
jgi:hypothetical protein